MQSFGKRLGATMERSRSRSRSASPKLTPEDVKNEVLDAIAVCYLAGFSAKKIRLQISTIEGFRKVDDRTFKTDNLDATARRHVYTREQQHQEIVSLRSSAAEQRAHAQQAYQREVVDKDRGAAPDEDEEREETRRWLRRWAEEVKVLNTFEQRALEAKYKAEIEGFAKDLIRNRPQEAKILIDEPTSKSLVNLQAINDGGAAKRSDGVSIDTKATEDAGPAKEGDEADGKASKVANDAQSVEQVDGVAEKDFA